VFVRIRRQWNDWRIAQVSCDALHGLHWSRTSGGVQAPAPQPFIHGYVNCDEIVGEIAHSCTHGPGPHAIKVCVVKKDNEAEVWRKLLEIVGPRPQVPPST